MKTAHLLIQCSDQIKANRSVLHYGLKYFFFREISEAQEIMAVKLAEAESNMKLLQEGAFIFYCLTSVVIFWDNLITAYYKKWGKISNEKWSVWSICNLA